MLTQNFVEKMKEQLLECKSVNIEGLYKELIRPSAKIAQREDTPIAIPTGIFKTKVTTNAINKTAATTIFHPRFFPAVFLPNTRLSESV